MVAQVMSTRVSGFREHFGMDRTLSAVEQNVHSSRTSLVDTISCGEYENVAEATNLVKVLSPVTHNIQQTAPIGFAPSFG